MKFSRARKITVAAAFVLVIVGLLFNTGTGTLSSFGWQQIAAICPLGVVEGFLASKTIFARALVVLGIALLFFGLFGKVFCAWLCPVPSLRDLLGRIGKRKPKQQNAVDAQGESANALKGEQTAQFQTNESSDGAGDDQSAGLDGTQGSTSQAAASAQVTQLTPAEKESLAVSGCSSCAEKRKKLDSRHIVLGGALVSAAIFGFPVFCLICPIGLTFGTIIIFWQWFGFNDISFSLLIYPAILIIELVVLKKWCTKLCPLGALLSLMSLPNRFFRPKVDAAKCLRSQGINCMVCVEACPEGLDPHSSQGMHECSKCGLCIEKCPTAAISLPLLNKKSAKTHVDKELK